MIKALFRGIATLAFSAATMAFLTAVSLLLLGSWLLTFPVLRTSPRERRLKASVEMAAAGLALLTAFAKSPETPDENPDE